MSQTAHAVIRPHQQQRIARAEERIHSFLNIATLGRQIDKISSSGSSFEGAGIFLLTPIIISSSFENLTLNAVATPSILFSKSPRHQKMS